MTKAPSVMAFDDASSWVVDSSASYTGDSSPVAVMTASTEDWKQRCAFLEGKVQSLTTILPDMLAKLEAENKRMSGEKQELATKCGFLEGKLQAQHPISQEMLAKLEAENKKISKEKQQLANSVNQITASLDAAREENKKIAGEVTRLVQEQGLAEKEMERLSTHAKTEMNKLSAEMHELANKLQQITAELDVSREENKNLMEKVETLVKEKEFQCKKAVWKSSQNKFATTVGWIDVLNGPILRSGKTKWKIAVNNSQGGMHLGVVSAHEANFSDNWLGAHPDTWGYYTSGHAQHGGKVVGGKHYPYTTGSVVTFLLDLTGQGTLSVAVDDNPLVELFGNMKSVVTEFIPAVYMFQESKVEFLGFE